MVKVKLSCTGLERPIGVQAAETPRIFRQSALEGGKVVRPKHRPLLPPWGVPGSLLISVTKLSRPQRHAAAEMITSMKNPKDHTGNRNRDLPTCKAIPEPNALRCIHTTPLPRPGIELR